ncbi:MAG: carboxypeptidase-like regulatory domain-containing protein [Acidobacteriota bacterium]
MTHSSPPLRPSAGTTVPRSALDLSALDLAGLGLTGFCLNVLALTVLGLTALSLTTTAAQAASPTRLVGIEGRVLTAGGGPLEGAEVALERVEAPATRLARLVRGDEAPTEARTTSDAEGRYRLSEVPGGVYVLVVSADGRLPLATSLMLVTDQRIPAVRLEAARAVPLRIVGPEGTPVAGALAIGRLEPESSIRSLRESMRIRGLRWLPRPRPRPSAPDGATTVLTTGDESIMVAAPGFAPARIDLAKAARDDDGRVTLRLERGTPLRLEVVDPRGRPLPGAVAVLASSDSPWIATRLPAAVGDTEGRLEISLPPEGLEISLLSRAHSATETFDAAPGDPPGSERVILRRGVRLEGRVVDGSTGEPLPNAFVSMPWAAPTTSGRDGVFMLESPFPFTQHAVAPEAAAPGYLHVPDPSQRRTGGQDAWVLSMQPAAEIVGRVVDERDAGVAEVPIDLLATLSLHWASLPIEVGQTVSDAQGGFELPLVPSGVAVKLLARPENRPPVSAELAPLEAGSRGRVELRLTTGLRAFGHVLDFEARPIPGAAVSLRPMEASRNLFEVRNLLDHSAESLATTDADGRFEIEGLEPGRWILAAEADGFASTAVPGIEIAPPEADASDGAGDGDGDAESRPRVDLGTLHLEPAVTLDGLVVDRDDRPVVGARVFVLPSGRQSSLNRSLQSFTRNEIVSDETGRFAVDGLRDGEQVQLNAYREGYVAGEPIAARAPTTEPLRIVLDVAARLMGRVVDTAGEPVAHAELRVSRGNERGYEMQAERTDTDGEFAIDTKPGMLQLTARSDEHRATTLDLEIDAGSRREGLELVLARGATLSGRVLGPDGTPVVDVQVGLDDRFNRLTARPMVQVDSDGRYRLGGLDEGPVTVTARHEHLGSTRASTRIEPGDDEVVLDLQFEDGVEVVGSIRGADTGQPLAGATLRLLGQSPRTATSDDTGTFRFEAVRPAGYRLEALADGYARSIRPLEVGESAPPSVELLLDRGASVHGVLRGLTIDELANAEVRLMSAHRAAAVDYQGVYRLDAVPTGEEIRLFASVGERSRMETLELAAGEQRQVDFDFGGDVTVRGIVRRDGEPQAGLRVFFSSRHGIGHSTQTATDGRFVLDMPPGRHELRVTGSSMMPLYQQSVEVRDDLELTIDLQVSVVEGRAVDATTGEPLVGVDLVLGGAEDLHWRTLSGLSEARSGADGRFRLETAADGPRLLEGRRDGYAPARQPVEVVLGATTFVDLEMTPARRLRLLVSGRVPPELHLAVLDAGGGQLDAQVLPTAGGLVELTRLGATAARLVIGAPGVATSRLEIPSGIEEIPVVLEPAVDVILEIPDLLGTQESVHLEAIGPMGPFVDIYSGGRLAPALSMRGGRRQIELPPGPWRLVATTRDGRSWSAAAELAVGRPLTVTLAPAPSAAEETP